MPITSGRRPKNPITALFLAFSTSSLHRQAEPRLYEAPQTKAVQLPKQNATFFPFIIAVVKVACAKVHMLSEPRFHKRHRQREYSLHQRQFLISLHLHRRGTSRGRASQAPQAKKVAGGKPPKQKTTFFPFTITVMKVRRFHSHNLTIVK